MVLTPSTMLELGTPLPEFRLPDPHGKLVASGDFADSPALLVAFICNHCPYVKHLRRELAQFARDYQGSRLAMVAINANDAAKYPDDSFPRMKEHAQEIGLNFPYLHDETQEVARAYGAERTPEVFLLDKGGMLRYHGTIDDNYEDPSAVKGHYMRDALDAVLAGQAPATAETQPVGCTIKWK